MFIEALARNLVSFAVNRLASLGVDPATGGLWVTLTSSAGSDAAPSVTVDQGLALVGAANVDCTTAHQLTTASGAGYIIVTNLDPSATVYLGASGVSGSTNGEALPAGASRSWRSANLALEYGIGSATVNVSVRR